MVDDDTQRNIRYIKMNAHRVLTNPGFCLNVYAARKIFNELRFYTFDSLRAILIVELSIIICKNYINHCTRVIDRKHSENLCSTLHRMHLKRKECIIIMC